MGLPRTSLRGNRSNRRRLARRVRTSALANRTPLLMAAALTVALRATATTSNRLGLHRRRRSRTPRSSRLSRTFTARKRSRMQRNKRAKHCKQSQHQTIRLVELVMQCNNHKVPKASNSRSIPALHPLMQHKDKFYPLPIFGVSAACCRFSLGSLLPTTT